MRALCAERYAEQQVEDTMRFNKFLCQTLLVLLATAVAFSCSSSDDSGPAGTAGSGGASGGPANVVNGGAPDGADASGQGGASGASPALSACERCIARAASDVPTCAGCTTDLLRSDADVALCNDILNCARSTQCAAEPSLEPGSACYCGSESPSICLAATEYDPLHPPAGACETQISAALPPGSAPAVVGADYTSRLGPIGVAIGRAVCEATNCAKECNPATGEGGAGGASGSAGAPGTKKGGAGGESTGVSSQACDQCVAAAVAFSPDCSVDCVVGPDELSSDSDAALCESILTCVRRTRCFADGMGDGTACYCGGVASTACFSVLAYDPNHPPTGSCANEIAAAFPVGSPPVAIGASFNYTQGPLGAAITRASCEQNFCKKECGLGTGAAGASGQ